MIPHTGSGICHQHVSHHKSKQTSLGVAYRVGLQLAVGANVEQTARGIIGAGTKGVAVGEELDGVDVRVVRRKGLHALLLADIPQLGEGIAGARDKLVVVERVYAQTHHVTQVVGKLVHLGARLQIPEHTGHVTGGGEDALVADEPAATQVARVARQLACHTRGAFPRGQVVDGADVIQATAGHVVPRGRVRARHDPR